jgi:hypothetical protein
VTARGRCPLCGMVHALHEYTASDGSCVLVCKWCLRRLEEKKGAERAEEEQCER